jgi:hypothetical protein
MTPTETQAKPLPNGTPGAGLLAKLKIRTIDPASLPSRSVGKGRSPGQFDDLVAGAKASGETKLIECGADEDTRKAIVNELRRSAEFHDIGMDVWKSLEDGVAFQTRPKRVRKPKGVA